MGISLDARQRASMLEYLTLLERWNSAFNLTAVRDPDILVARHLLDSLSILHLLTGLRILDVGSGAGLPGIPLAIARPGLHFTLLDANGKKTRFLEQCRLSLCLPNLLVVRSRAEAYRPGEGYDMILTRAFSSLADTMGLTSHLLRPAGCWLAMKGTLRPAELDQAQAGGAVIQVHKLRVPGVDGARHAVIGRQAQ